MLVELERRLIRTISKVYLGEVVSKFFSFGTLLLLIRGLNIEDYAAFTAFWSIFTMVPGLVGTGINKALIRFSAEYISKNKDIPIPLYLGSFIFQVLLYNLIMMFLFLFIDKINFLVFGKREFLFPLKLGLIGGIGILFIQAVRSVFQAEERFKFYIMTLLARDFFIFVLILFLALTKRLEFLNVAIVFITVNILVGIGSGCYIFRKKIDLNQMENFFKNHAEVIKNFIHSTFWLITYFIMLSLFQRMDIFMLSHLSTELELAIYGVAFRYYSAVLLLLNSIHAVLLPKFSKIEMMEINKQKKFMLKWVSTLGWVIIPLIVFDFWGKSLFTLLNGTQYEKSFQVFVIFSIGIWLSLTFSPTVSILMSRKEFKFLFELSVISVILNFIGNYYFIPIWGAKGASFVTILTHAVINVSATLKVFCQDKK